MHSLKRKFRSKRRLNSASSSTLGSLSDLDERVIMFCEDVPTESSFDSGQSSHSLCARPSRGSQSEEQELGSERHVMHLSRERHSYRQARYGDREPQKEYYIQRVVEVYGEFTGYSVSLCNLSLWSLLDFDPLRCSELVPACYYIAVNFLAKCTEKKNCLCCVILIFIVVASLVFACPSYCNRDTRRGQLASSNLTHEICNLYHFNLSIELQRLFIN